MGLKPGVSFVSPQMTRVLQILFTVSMVPKNLSTHDFQTGISRALSLPEGSFPNLSLISAKDFNVCDPPSKIFATKKSRARPDLFYSNLNVRN